MKRRNLFLSGAAILVFGVGFAAQPTSDRADRESLNLQERDPWVPGTDMVMSAHDTALQSLAPPR